MCENHSKPGVIEIIFGVLIGFALLSLVTVHEHDRHINRAFTYIVGVILIILLNTQ